jgi:predicted transcriptional regulator
VVYDSLSATEQNLAAQLVASEERTASQFTNISDQLGRSAQVVTQQDIDAIADLVLEAQTATTPVTYTDQQLMYDVNNDGVINTNDQTTLQQLMQQQTTGVYADNNLAIDPTNVFADTGVFGVIADQNARTARQNQQQQRSRQQQQQRNQFNQQLQQVLQPGATTKVTGGGLADIGGFYNPITASGIFATPKENDMFAAVNPYGSPSNQNSNAEGVLGEINRIMGRSA